jgi:hypothetical protein
MEVTHLGCATVHQLITDSLLMNPKVDPVQHVAHGIDCLSLEASWSPMLIEHRSSHLAQCPVFPFHHVILGRCIQTRKLLFKTQVIAKVLKQEFFNSEPLSLQITRMASPCLSFLNLETRSRTKPNVSPFSKEHPRIPSAIVNHN